MTKNITGCRRSGTIVQIDASHFDAGTAYVAVDFHLVDNREPFIYKTTDFGATWKKVTGDLPSKHTLDYVLSVAENPNKKGMLFAGTGHAFYYSMDDGAHWTQFKDGLPAAPVTWIVVEPRYHDVVVSTYGRGLFILREHHACSSRPGRRWRRPRRRRGSSRRGPGSVRRAADRRSSCIRCRRRRRPGAAGDPRRGRAGDSHAADRGIARRAEPRQLEPACTSPRAWSRSARRRKDNPHIWEEPRLHRARDAAGRRTGASAATTATPIAAPGQVLRAAHDRRHAVHAAVRDPEGSADSVVGRRSGGVDEDAGAHPRRHQRDVRHGQPDGSHAPADRRSAEGEPRQGRARKAADGSGREDLRRSSCSW